MFEKFVKIIQTFTRPPLSGPKSANFNRAIVHKTMLQWTRFYELELMYFFKYRLKSCKAENLSIRWKFRAPVWIVSSFHGCCVFDESIDK